MESRFLEPPGKTQIGSRNREFEKSNVASNYAYLRDVGGYVGSTHNALYPTILSCTWGGGRKERGEGRGLQGITIENDVIGASPSLAPL